MEKRRRELLTTALASAGVLAAGPGRAAAAPLDDTQALLQIRDELRALRDNSREPPGEVIRIRQVQNTFLRATSKFPDAIEIGTRYWEVVSDWLHESPQPVEVSQMTNGRYAIRLGFTYLVLRPDVPPDYLGTGQDR